MAKEILNLEDLSVSYFTAGGKVTIIKRVNLGFEEGKITALIGESGCGKTTLANAIMGILPNNAEIEKDSKIFFRDKNILLLPAEERRKFRWQRVSIVFQAAQNAMNPTLPVSEQLMDPVWDHQGSVPPNEARQKVEALLKMVRLNPKRVMKAYPHELSGGMKQRVIIAMALVLDPELLILDEPTTALDVITQLLVFDILMTLQRQRNLSMILITHDLAAAARLAQTAAIMQEGKIVETAPITDIFKNPQHPYTKALLQASLLMNSEGKEEILT